MNRDIRVNLSLGTTSLERIKDLDFEKLISDIELLSQQLPVDVDPYYRNKKIDYGSGYRSVNVRMKSESFLSLVYSVIDSARVEGSTNQSDSVGSRTYTQKEVDEMRARAKIRENIEID